MLALQWLKYPQAQVIIFDKDRSARAATLAVGGSYFEPGNHDASVAFQPLGHLDTQADITWANEFVQALFLAQGLAPSPTLKQAIAKAIEILSTEHPPEERTITMLSHRLESFDREYTLPLQPYQMGGSYGQIFDAAEDRVSPTAWTLIEMGHLMQMGAPVIVPALLYLFRRVEQQLTGAPTLLILDEAWLFLSHPVFAERLQAWLKTLRKKNVFVVFATQEVADASRNPALQSTILSACPTKIYLADPEATTPAMAADYERLGLSPTEIETIAGMAKKRDYYVRSTLGRRVFTLALGPAQLTFAGMASERDHRFLDQMVATREPGDYAQAMLEHRGVTWAVQALREQQGDIRSSPPGGGRRA
jgi:type IV secretion system protein VirB4